MTFAFRAFALFAIGIVTGGCAGQIGPAAMADGPVPLARDEAGPKLAMFEHILSSYFEADIVNPPTVCVAEAAGAGTERLPEDDEAALMERFAGLAPLPRCVERTSGIRDEATDEPAMLFVLNGFRCDSAVDCSAISSYRFGDTRSDTVFHRAHWSGGRWSFSSDSRVIAE
ncbi:hypothetical protein [Aurantiacibacter spongiae]|uniref:Lipoprotein n=1 Tax=Aurantiacibacter spongiae TaxID=2488860 RepID=A0A3N5CNN2_9SPHN|nr:hypothetical protein [Aurantiacibacter spongiae]RPF70563.1 hypothetical protein EG799_02190 [Aurantiacibacter spongiae]